MRKWGGVTAGRRPAPSSLISLSVACLHSPAPSGSQEQNQGVETQDMRSDRECDMRYLSPPRRRRQSGARRGRRSHSLSPLRRRGGGRREQKKNERRSTRTRASSPANRSGELPRESKRELPANDETGRGSPRRHRARASAAAVYREQVSPARAARAAEHEVRVDVGRVDRLHAALPHARETLPVADARRGPRRGEPSLPGG